MNMNKLFFLFCFVLLNAVQLMAQEGLTVPSQMRFADLELTIEPRTRDKIQQRVNQIAGNWTLYRDLSERSQLYSPLITQTLREESCPEDLQYIALQLSGLVADATSPRQAGATGFWLISTDIAKENGLQVDNVIDERKSIITATRAFARAMHKNNYSMRNWIYAYIAYQVGLSNAFGIIDRSRIGMAQLPIDEKTPDYVIEMLAYTFVFRNQQNVATNPIQLLVYNETQGKTLDAIAKAANLPVEQVRYYNSWLAFGNIPRNMPVYLPVPNDRVSAVSMALQINNSNQSFAATAARFSDAKTTANGSLYPVITNRFDRRIGNKDFTFATINGIPGMIAADGQSIEELATAAGISKNKLIKLNDFNDKSALLGAGQVLYLKAKKGKGPVKDHLVLPNESFWSISQDYGITLSSLLKLNRIDKNEAPQPGRVLVLQERRAKNAPPEYRELPAINPTIIQNAPELQLDNTMTADPNAAAKATGIHIVQAGESIYEIAAKYGVTITDLRRWNGITGFTLTPGMELKIRGEALPDLAAVTTTDTTAVVNNVPADGSLLAPPTSDIDVLKTSTTQEKPTHTVKQGDNLYAIAQQYGITVSSLRAWNNLPVNAIIKEGDVLKLYDPSVAIIAGGAQQLNVVSGNTQVTKHIVQRGETLTKIANKYGTTVPNLRAWNNLQTDAIAINQELIVSGPPTAVNAATPNAGTTVINVMQTGATPTTATATNQGVHQITFGQSVEDIVRMYNLNADDFYRWNNMTPGSTTFAMGTTTVYVADPSLVNSGAFNVTPQPYTNPAVSGGNANAITGSTPVQNATTVTAAVHKVQAGETLFGISRKYNIPIGDLMRWNNMDMSTKLQMGQTILVQAPGSTVSVAGTESGTMLSNISEPTGVVMRGNTNVQASSANPMVGAEEARIYTSIPGDNIYDLANRFGVRLSDFKKWNNIPVGVFTLPVGTPIAINEAAAAQVASMKAQTAQPKATAKGVIAEKARPSTTNEVTTTGKGSIVYHVVNKGETLFSIARKYKVKVDQIKNWNQLKNDRVNAGSRIIVSQ
jgi:membrane-bound lytic murein transglycosylase D